jgi:hypothetical protein
MKPDLQTSALSYMNTLLEEILKPSVSNNSFSDDVNKISSEVFKILSSREFTYFTRVKSEPYRTAICSKIENLYNAKKQLVFYFNLGGGYHAKVSGELDFEPGLSELLAIFQIKKFLNKISDIYPFGVYFEIIIDNRCAEFANEISIENTVRYSNKLKEIIRKLRLNEEIKVVLESDLVSKEDLNDKILSLEKSPVYKITDKDRQNASRFSDSADTSKKDTCVEKYKVINKISRDLSSEYSKNGIHLTQRPTERSFPFRSFPGGDSKIQCGKVALLSENGDIKRPVLITTNNIENFNLSKINLSEKFVIPNLLVAVNKNQ